MANDLTEVDAETAQVKFQYNDQGTHAGLNFECKNPDPSALQAQAGYTMVASIPSSTYNTINSGVVFKPRINETMFTFPIDFDLVKFICKMTWLNIVFRYGMMGIAMASMMVLSGDQDA